MEDRMNDELTFAEAMEVWRAGNAVECLGDGTGTNKFRLMPLDDDDDGSVVFQSWMIRAPWRKSRPKRSRIQELAEAIPGETSVAGAMDAAVRTVCHHIRDIARGHKDHDAGLADEILRVFLEPR
jgi:hypothetical protein